MPPKKKTPPKTNTENVEAAENLSNNDTTTKKTSKKAAKGGDEELTNGDTSPPSSPPAKRSKRNSSGKADPTPKIVTNGDSKEPKRKKGTKAAPDTIPEDEELNTDNVSRPEPEKPQEPPLVNGAKRVRRLSRQQEETNAKRAIKLSFRHTRGTGTVLTVGQGDTGQLGLGEDVMEKSRPAPVTSIKDAVDAVAGGMHTAVLDKDGQVWTFGCNDEGSLGRLVDEEEDCFIPGKVEIEEKMIMLSAGDSHTAALAESGQVYIWGTFRDSSGPIGLIDSMKIEKTPVKVLTDVHIAKIVSGSDHLVMLGSDGQIWTMGNSEQGQLGRVNEKFAHRGGRRGLMALLRPEMVRVNFRSKISGFKDVWAGSYNTVARTDGDQIVVMGLNNYSQLALPTTKGLSFFMPYHSKEMTPRSWRNIAIGQHHAICLEEDGKVYALGRQEYGRLGLGEGGSDAIVPSHVTSLESECIEVACGTAVSYAVTEKGECLAWGMGTNGQLGTGEEDDVYEPTKMKGKQLEGKKVLVVSSGGQHTVLIAK